MAELSGFPAEELQFDKDAGIVGSADAVRALAADPATTDLLVLSHGWNNDMREARDLYAELAAALRAGVGSVPGVAGRGVAIVEVLWPSKKFADTDLIPGGAAAAGSPIDPADVAAQVTGLGDLFDDPAAQQTLASAAALVPQLEDRATAREAYADALRSLLDPRAAEAVDASTDLFAASGVALMDRLQRPASLAPPEGVGGGAAAALGGAAALGEPGGAAGLGSLIGGVLGAARNLANFVTYYQMKARAGTVGAQGLAPVLVGIQGARPDLRIHLAGHSFGGRLVSSAASQLETPLASLTLLQAAYSHYGFAENWDGAGANGLFRAVVADKLVSGPILITHSAHDTAVGIAYAIASRIAGQVAAAVGDADDKFGGMGRNGAQKTPEAVEATLLDVGGAYQFQPSLPHNLRGDQFISGHSDITGPQVAYALLSAIAS